MLTVEDAQPLWAAVGTGANVETLTSCRHRDRSAATWQRSIDLLEDWFRDPSQVEDDGIDAPDRTILRSAIEFADKLRDEGYSPPTTVVPDPNGGVVLERREGDIAEVFQFWEDGSLDYQRFSGTKLVDRRAL